MIPSDENRIATSTIVIRYSHQLVGAVPTKTMPSTVMSSAMNTARTTPAATYPSTISIAESGAISSS